MKRINLLTTILFLFWHQSGHACINEYRTLLNGKVIYTTADNMAPTGRFGMDDKSYISEELHKADSIYQKTRKTEDYSDLGAMLVYAGQYLKAKKIFEDIERKVPGLYQTAANLGTTYELLGQNDSALFWIKRAIEINPQSHNGSEWIHVKILEAKIKADGDQTYFQKHSILSLDFGNDEIPVNNTDIELNNLREQLYDQLNERISFIKPKDPIVAQLLFDLGNVSAMTIDVKSGLEVFEVAQKYGYSSSLLDKRQTYFKKLQANADSKFDFEKWFKEHILLVLIVIASAFLGLVVIMIFVQNKSMG